MDGHDDLREEFDALHNPRKVMTEVLNLVEELRRGSTKLGDALVAAGFPARDWLTNDARLALLSESFPDVTVDAFLTRLAEFAASAGPHWLRGDEYDIERFNEEVSILYGVARPLRAQAQRLRMLSARSRGHLPMEQALGDARVGTPLDIVSGRLRDLESLAPFITPISPEEWKASERESAASVPPVAVPAQAPAPSEPDGAQLAAANPSASTGQFTRLRDFAPPSATPRQTLATSRGASLKATTARLAKHSRALAAGLRPHKWMLVALSVLVLAAGTGILTLALAISRSAPPSRLVAKPSTLTLACSGKGATVSLTLQNTSTSSLDWTTKAPSGLNLSATHGSLKPGTTVTLQAKVTTAKATHGTLAFTAGNDAATIPYTVTC
jgi:hypothetical protein